MISLTPMIYPSLEERLEQFKQKYLGCALIPKNIIAIRYEMENINQAYNVKGRVYIGYNEIYVSFY